MNELINPFKNIPVNRIVFIGLGNPDRGDDAIGLEIASQLKLIFKEQVYSEPDISVESFVVHTLENKNICAFCLIDAVDFCDSPGRWQFFGRDDLNQFILPISTHKVPIHILADIIVQHEKRFYLLGIQPKSTKWMEPLSKELVKSAENVISILRQIGHNSV